MAFLRAYGGFKKAFGPIINPISKVLSRVIEAGKRAFWEIYIVVCQSFTNWFHIIARNSKKLSAKIGSFGRQKKTAKIEYEEPEKQTETTDKSENEDAPKLDTEEAQDQEKEEAKDSEKEEAPEQEQESNLNQNSEPIESEIPVNQDANQESEL